MTRVQRVASLATLLRSAEHQRAAEAWLAMYRNRPMRRAKTLGQLRRRITTRAGRLYHVTKGWRDA